MQYRDIIAVGASAGGLRAIQVVARGLPRDLPAALVVAIHLSPDADRGVVERLIGHASALPVQFARDDDRIVRGRIYLAPPDRHLLVDGDRLRVLRGALENGSRPAIDPLFRSVACSARGRAIGVVLTGYLDDGVEGLIAIRRCGGMAVVQDPASADYPDMPNHAIARAQPDHVVPLDRMAPHLASLAGTPAGPMAPPPPELALEVRLAARQGAGMAEVDRLGAPSDYTCPECHGSLRQVPGTERPRYRCHTGHGYTLESLASSQGPALERALSSALRALEERAHLLQRLSVGSSGGGRSRTAEQFARKAAEYKEQAEFIRRILLQGSQLPGDPAEARN